MPKFYFSVSDHGRLGRLEDTEGADLPDLDAARLHAYAVAREIMQNREGMLGEPWPKWTMHVKNSKGEEVFSFPLQEVLPKADKSPPQSRG
jgi:hypothetical protein